MVARSSGKFLIHCILTTFCNAVCSLTFHLVQQLRLLSLPPTKLNLPNFLETRRHILSISQLETFPNTFVENPQNKHVF